QGALAQLREDQHAARGGQRLHHLRDQLRVLGGDRAAQRVSLDAVGHGRPAANMSARSLNERSYDLVLMRLHTMTHAPRSPNIPIGGCQSYPAPAAPAAPARVPAGAGERL